MDYNVTYRKKDKGTQAIISYKDINGIWKQKSKQGYKTQKDSKKWVEDTIEELSKTIKYIDADHAKDSFKELYEDFIEHIELYNQENTINNYYRAKIYFEALDEMKVKNINAINIQSCVDKMVKRGLKASTINNHVVKLKTIFKYAIKNRVIFDNPVFSITIPDNKDISKKIKALTKIETDNLLNKLVIPRQYYISLIAATCGLRIGELLAIKWSDIDEKNNTLTVNKQWKLLKRKPVQYGEGIVKRPNSNRIVPIPQSTIDELKKYKSNYPIDISGRLFPYKTSNSASALLKEQYHKLGYKISAHDLRHTYVSMLVSSGLDFQTIASLIGDTVAITIKIYSHFTSDMMTKAKNAVNSIF